jgi:hypothetical protein
VRVAALLGLALLAARPASAQEPDSPMAWARRAARRGGATAAESVPPGIRRVIEIAAARAAGAGEARLRWVRPVDGDRLIALSLTSAVGEPDRGALALIGVSDDALVTLGSTPVPPGPAAAFDVVGAGDVDGDGAADAVARWKVVDADGTTRRGLALVRSAPAGIAAVELEVVPKAGRRVEAPVACFARVEGLKGRALVSVRRSVGEAADVVDLVEVRVPGAGGGLVPGGLYAGRLTGDVPAAEARRLWAKAFGGGAEGRQAAGGACPADGLLLPARAVSAGGRGSDASTVVGPFALTPEAVQTRLAKLRPRLPADPQLLHLGD